MPQPVASSRKPGNEVATVSQPSIRTGADATDIELAVRRHRLRTLDAFLAARHSHAPQN